MQSQEQHPLLLHICGNQNAGKSGLANVLAHSFGCTPILNGPCVPNDLEGAAAAQPIPIAGAEDDQILEQLDKHYKHLVLPDRPASKPAQQHNSGIPAATHAAAAAAGGASAAQPLGAQSGAVHHSKRRGLFTIEDDCDHATWLMQCVHFEPDGSEVSLVITYRSRQTVLEALKAAHAVLQKAQSAAQHGPAQVWEVLNDRARCINAALRYTGWPSEGFERFKKHISAPIGGVPQDLTPARMVTELRSALRLSRAHWQQLGHAVSLPLPQACSVGEALKVLQAQHAWVSMADTDPDKWQGNRFLGLISHLDITLPAPSATCRITIRDGQGQEVSTPGSSSSASDGYGLQQQQQAGQHAAAMAAGDVGGGGHSWQWLEALGVPCDRVYVLKEANASGLASLQQEITPEMKSAWVKSILSSSQDRQQQQTAGQAEHAADDVLPVLMVGVMFEKIHPDIFGLVAEYKAAKASREGTCIASSLQELQAQVADYMSGHPGQKTIATLQQHVSRKLAAALVSVQGVDPGQEDAFAQRIMDAGGVVIQPLFPWLWAGGEVAAHRSLKGVGTGELLNPTQSGLQALHGMLLRRSPSQLSPREAMLQRAAAAQQHLQDLLTLQAVGGAALSTLPESAQGVVKSALLKFRQQAELLVQQQAEQLERTIVPAVKAEVPVFWKQIVHAACASNTPERVARRLLAELFPELQLQQHAAPAAPQAMQGCALDRLVQEAKAQGADMRGLPGLLCKLLKDELPTNRPLPELLFVSLLEDRLPRKSCIPPDLDLPQEMTQLQQLQAAIQHAIQHPQDLAACAGSTQHADASLDEVSQQPLLLTFQIETCTQLVALATAAAEEAAAQVTQHDLQAPTGTAAGAAGTSCSGAAEVQKVVLQASTAWIKDLATRLAHYTCRYLFDVLKWQSGWSLRQVYSGSGLSHGLLERLADIGSALREVGKDTPGDASTQLELFEHFVLGADSLPALAVPAEAGSSSAPGATKQHSAGQLMQQQHCVLSWLSASLSEGLTAACWGALDDLGSGLQQELVNWADSIRGRAEQVSAVSTTTATEASWQQLFCGAFTAEVFGRAANNLLPAQHPDSSSSRTSPSAPAGPGTSEQAATPSANDAAGSAAGSDSSSSMSVLKQLRMLLCSEPAQKLLEEAQKYYTALLSGPAGPQQPTASSGSSIHVPAACWQQQLELFEQVVGMMGHKLSQKLGGVPQALKLLESLASRHSAQLNTLECSKPHKGSKRKGGGSDAATNNSIDVWVELPAADCSIDTSDSISSTATAASAAAAAAGEAAAAGGAGGIEEDSNEQTDLGVLIIRVQADSPAAWLEALLVGVYGQMTPQQLATHLSNLPSAPPLAPPDQIKEAAFTSQRERNMQQQLWGSEELSTLVEVLMPRARRKQPKLRNAHPLFLPTTGDISALTCTKAAKHYNEIVRLKHDLKKVKAWTPGGSQIKIMAGQLVVGWYRNEGGDGNEYFRLLGVVTGQPSDAELLEHLQPEKAAAAIAAAAAAKPGPPGYKLAAAAAGAAAGAAASPTAGEAGAGAAAPAGAPAGATAAAPAGAAGAAAAAATAEEVGAAAAAATAGAGAGGGNGSTPRYWRVKYEDGDVAVFDQQEVEEMALPVRVDRKFIDRQRAHLAAAGLDEPDDTETVIMGRYRVLGSWELPALQGTKPQHGINHQRLLGPYGDLRSRQEVQAALVKLQAELAAADKPMLEGEWVRNVGPARHFGPLQGLSSNWMWREQYYISTNRVQAYWRYHGDGWVKDCNSKPTAQLWEDGLLAASMQQQQELENVSPVVVDSGPLEVRSNIKYWSQTPGASTYYFDALDKLQAPGVKLWLNIWARHNGKASNPALRLTTTAAAEFIRDGVIEFNSQSVRLVRRMPRDPDRPGYASAVPLTGEDMEQLLAFSSRGGGAKQPKKKKQKKKKQG